MTKANSKSKSRALVLSLVDSSSDGGGSNSNNEGQPLPLGTYHPCSHSLTLRRSPRFSPLPSEIHNVGPRNPKSPPKSGRDFKTCLRRCRRLNWSSGSGNLEKNLSLVFEERPLRRSPRLGNGSAGVEKKKVVHVLVQEKSDSRKGKRVLRKNSEEKEIQKWSPRWASASSLGSLRGEFEMKSQSLKVKSKRNEGQSMTVRLYCAEEQTKGCLNESKQCVPAEFGSEQLSLTWHEHDDKKTLPISCNISTAFNGEYQRRSPRLTLEAQNGADNNYLSTVVAQLLNDKQLQMPPRHISLLNGTWNTEIDFHSGELSDFQDGWPSKWNKLHSKNYDLEMVDENFWRQASRISNSAPGAANEKINCSSIELPKSVKKKPLMNSVRQCFSEEINSLALKEKWNKHIALLIGDPVPRDEAQERWCWRYDHKS